VEPVLKSTRSLDFHCKIHYALNIEYANTLPPTRAIFKTLKLAIEVKRIIVCFSSWDKLTENRSDLIPVCGHILSKFNPLHSSLLYSIGQMKCLWSYSTKTDDCASLKFSSVSWRDCIYTFI